MRFTPPHDLRRTCRTLMSRLGVEPNIAELAIGHKRKGLERLYNFDEAWQLRCDASAKVSDNVAALLRNVALTWKARSSLSRRGAEFGGRKAQSRRL